MKINKPALVQVDVVIGLRLHYQGNKGTVTGPEDDLGIVWDDGATKTSLISEHGKSLLASCEAL